MDGGLLLSYTIGVAMPKGYGYGKKRKKKKKQRR